MLLPPPLFCTVQKTRPLQCYDRDVIVPVSSGSKALSKQKMEIGDLEIWSDIFAPPKYQKVGGSPFRPKLDR